MKKGKLGELLVKAKLISDSQLQKAVEMQKILGGKLGSIIVKLGFITDDELVRFLARQENLPIVDLARTPVQRALVQSLSKETLEKHQVLPIKSKDGVLTLAMSDPTDYDAIEEIQFLTNSQIDIAMASRAQISKALTRIFYPDAPQKESSAPDETAGAPAAEAEDIEPGLQKALIPLLVEKGIISLEELKIKARELQNNK